MTCEQQEAYEALCSYETGPAVNALLDFHGTQLLSDEFIQFLRNEGYMEGGSVHDETV